jgi:hypothetical protein
MKDISQKVNISALSRVLIEDAVLDKLHSSVLQCLKVLPGPDFLQPLLDDRATVLHNELQLGVDLAQLQGEAADASPDINNQCIAQGGPWEICVM